MYVGIGVELKFRRALQHAAQLSDAVRSADIDSYWRIVAKLEPETGDYVQRLDVLKPFPQEWSLLLGDAIHNARGALDLLACEIVKHDGGHVTSQTQFPVAESESKLVSMVPRTMKGARRTSIAALMDLRPWKDGNSSIYDLHRLDIYDKHRQLLPVLAHTVGLNMQTTFHAAPEDDVDDQVVEILIPNDGGPEVILDGEEFSRESAAIVASLKEANENTTGWISMRSGTSLTLAFGSDARVPARSIVPGLADMISDVREAVQPLAARLTAGD
jgi:hypothetical protein